ncbi:TPA: hypothetical protein DCE37_17275 [Candidatus Latescibacteria bacterium]|nr:hypothetical protein [Candidatus Latescibacterota bacterium]
MAAGRRVTSGNSSTLQTSRRRRRGKNYGVQRIRRSPPRRTPTQTGCRAEPDNRRCLHRSAGGVSWLPRGRGASVHPANDKAPAKNLGLVLFYVPPHVVLEPGSHSTEEPYVMMAGEGEMTFERSKRKIKKGDFVYLPPWCVHGIENTGSNTLVVLICTSPPNP